MATTTCGSSRSSSLVRERTLCNLCALAVGFLTDLFSFRDSFLDGFGIGFSVRVFFFFVVVGFLFCLTFANLHWQRTLLRLLLLSLVQVALLQDARLDRPISPR